MPRSKTDGLRWFIRQIRKCKSDAEEKKLIEEIIQSVNEIYNEKNNEIYKKSGIYAELKRNLNPHYFMSNNLNYVTMMMYVSMLGYNVDFDINHCLNIIEASMTNRDFHSKRIGYLSITLLWTEDISNNILENRLIELLITDLNSESQIHKHLALTCISNMPILNGNKSLINQIESILTDNVQKISIGNSISRDIIDITKKCLLCLTNMITFSSKHSIQDIHKYIHSKLDKYQRLITCLLQQQHLGVLLCNLNLLDCLLSNQQIRTIRTDLVIQSYLRTHHMINKLPLNIIQICTRYFGDALVPKFGCIIFRMIQQIDAVYTSKTIKCDELDGSDDEKKKDDKKNSNVYEYDYKEAYKYHGKFNPFIVAKLFKILTYFEFNELVTNCDDKALNMLWQLIIYLLPKSYTQHHNFAYLQIMKFIAQMSMDGTFSSDDQFVVIYQDAIRLVKKCLTNYWEYSDHYLTNQTIALKCLQTFAENNFSHSYIMESFNDVHNNKTISIIDALDTTICCEDFYIVEQTMNVILSLCNETNAIQIFRLINKYLKYCKACSRNISSELVDKILLIAKLKSNVIQFESSDEVLKNYDEKYYDAIEGFKMTEVCKDILLNVEMKDELIQSHFWKLKHWWFCVTILQLMSIVPKHMNTYWFLGLLQDGDDKTKQYVAEKAYYFIFDYCKHEERDVNQKIIEVCGEIFRRYGYLLSAKYSILSNKLDSLITNAKTPIYINNQSLFTATTFDENTEEKYLLDLNNNNCNHTIKIETQRGFIWELNDINIHKHTICDIKDKIFKDYGILQKAQQLMLYDKVIKNHKKNKPLIEWGISDNDTLQLTETYFKDPVAAMMVNDGKCNCCGIFLVSMLFVIMFFADIISMILGAKGYSNSFSCNKTAMTFMKRYLLLRGVGGLFSMCIGIWYLGHKNAFDLNHRYLHIHLKISQILKWILHICNIYMFGCILFGIIGAISGWIDVDEDECHVQLVNTFHIWIIPLIITDVANLSLRLICVASDTKCCISYCKMIRLLTESI